MGQDLREMFKKEREETHFQMGPGHEARFLEKLEEALPKQPRSPWYMFKIAASIAVLIGLGVVGLILFNQESTPGTTIVEKDKPLTSDQGISLGDLSPNLKKVENYYVANINLELSRLEISKENKLLVDSFMERLSELNVEYEALNNELNEIGPNDQTINAMIKNLQLRLQLLQKLRTKLNELKSSKNEQVENII